MAKDNNRWTHTHNKKKKKHNLWSWVKTYLIHENQGGKKHTDWLMWVKKGWPLNEINGLNSKLYSTTTTQIANTQHLTTTNDGVECGAPQPQQVLPWPPKPTLSLLPTWCASTPELRILHFAANPSLFVSSHSPSPKNNRWWVCQWRFPQPPISTHSNTWG